MHDIHHECMINLKCFYLVNIVSKGQLINIIKNLYNMNLFRRRSDVFVVDFNPFQSSVTFLYLLKASENLWPSDVLSGYRNVVWCEIG